MEWNTSQLIIIKTKLIIRYSIARSVRKRYVTSPSQFWFSNDSHVKLGPHSPTWSINPGEIVIAIFPYWILGILYDRYNNKHIHIHEKKSNKRRKKINGKNKREDERWRRCSSSFLASLRRPICICWGNQHGNLSRPIRIIHHDEGAIITDPLLGIKWITSVRTHSIQPHSFLRC